MTWKQQRQEAAHRRRRIIFNSDAGECDPGSLKSTDPQEYLDLRKSGLVGSSVDAIFHCSDVGFNRYTHYSDVSEIGDGHNPMLKAMIEQGTDPLRITTEFCRANDIELFWSMRISDEHDQWHDWALSQFKRDHPELLLGSKDKRPPHGPWSGVDYAREEVRDLVFRTVQDVCSRYDVDGVELDFFRQLACFKPTAWGRPLGQEHRDAMTSLLRRIRTVADEQGRERGRPILLAVRVPDSVGYCWELGFDLLRWLADDLIDIMIVGGYFRLRPWEWSVELGHRYDVPVYASLDASRVGNWPWVLDAHKPDSRPECMLARRSDESYQAQALSAWDAGADGIYLFNFNYSHPPSHRLWTDLGDPMTLAALDKTYHVDATGWGHPSLDHYLPAGRGTRFFKLPDLSPDRPQELLPGETLTTWLSVADDVQQAMDRDLVPDLKLNVQAEHLPAAGAVSVRLNGQVLKQGSLTWQSALPDTWGEYAVAPATLSKGRNRIDITLGAENSGDMPCVIHDILLRIHYNRRHVRHRGPG